MQSGLLRASASMPVGAMTVTLIRSASPRPVVGSTTMILGTLRINEKRPSDEWVLIVGMFFVGVTSVAASFWEERRRVQRDLLPRQRRLEALRKELDG